MIDSILSAYPYHHFWMCWAAPDERTSFVIFSSLFIWNHPNLGAKLSSDDQVKNKQKSLHPIHTLPNVAFECTSINNI